MQILTGKIPVNSNFVYTLLPQGLYALWALWQQATNRGLSLVLYSQQRAIRPPKSIARLRLRDCLPALPVSYWGEV